VPYQFFSNLKGDHANDLNKKRKKSAFDRKLFPSFVTQSKMLNNRKTYSPTRSAHAERPVSIVAPRIRRR
jgi:hypothetical protein